MFSGIKVRAAAWMITIATALGALANFIGNWETVSNVLKNAWHFQRRLEMKLNYDHVTRILSYQTPTDGFISLWNKNGKGEMIRMDMPCLPFELGCVLPYHTITPETPHTQEINTSDVDDVDQILLLWSPKEPSMMRQQYRGKSDFDIDLQELDDYEITDPVQVKISKQVAHQQ